MKTFKFLPVFVLCLAFTYVCCRPQTEEQHEENIPGHEHKEGCGHPLDKIKKGISTIAGKIKNATIAAKDAVVNTYKDIKQTIKTKVEEHKKTSDDKQFTPTEKGIPNNSHYPSPSVPEKYPFDNVTPQHFPGHVPTNFHGDNNNNHGTGNNGGRDVTAINVNGYDVTEGTGFQNAYGNHEQNVYSSTSGNSGTEFTSDGGFNTGLSQSGNANNAESSVNRDPSLLDRQPQPTSQPTSEDVQAGIINPRIDRDNGLVSSRISSRQ